jgi:hypothetical protein
MNNTEMNHTGMNHTAMSRLKKSPGAKMPAHVVERRERRELIPCGLKRLIKIELPSTTVIVPTLGGDVKARG